MLFLSCFFFVLSRLVSRLDVELLVAYFLSAWALFVFRSFCLAMSGIRFAFEKDVSLPEPPRDDTVHIAAGTGLADLAAQLAALSS